MNPESRIVSVFLVVFFFSTVDAGPVVYVDATALPGGDGQAWGTAFRFLADALEFADDESNGVEEIRVADGVYFPGQTNADPTGSTAGAATFALVSDVALRGGYPGSGSEDPDARDPSAFVSVLSGDIGVPGEISDNVFHVLRSFSGTTNAVVDGFTITGGNARNPSNSNGYGGGLVADTGASVFAFHCIFIGNRSLQEGGGVGFRNSSGGDVADCTFVGNVSEGVGGGVSTRSFQATFSRCRFIENSAGVRGGGLFGEVQIFTVSHCEFVGNSADMGGGFWYTGGNLTVANCGFFQNSATNGAGIGTDRDAGSLEAVVANCTIADNGATQLGGGLFHDDSIDAPQLTSCVVWGNSDGVGMAESAQLAGDSDVPSISFCCIQGLTGQLGGSGNIGLDPMFLEPSPGEYRLAPGSPCIDAGLFSPPLAGILTDLDGNPRFIDDPQSADCPQAPGSCGVAPVVDMGAYEFQGIPEGAFIRGDANGDALIDIGDPVYGLSYLIDNGAAACLDAIDFNDDGAVDMADPIHGLSYLFSNGPSTPPPSSVCAVDPTSDGLDCGEYVCN